MQRIHATNIGGREVGTMKEVKMEIKQYQKEKIQLVRDYDVLKWIYLHDWEIQS